MRSEKSIMLQKDENIKMSRFPISLFAIYAVTLLLMSGIHTGLIVLSNKMNWSEIIQTIIPIIYWTVVAVVLTVFTRSKIKRTYEEPMHKLADATSKVAKGDFSVYVPVLHTKDRVDYLDVMIEDFNKMVEELGSIETLKTDFVSNVSHEMKTPISIIKNYSQLIEKNSANKGDEDCLAYAKTIEDAADRMSGLINNILKLNKLENQTIVPEIEPYDVCRQICDCIMQYDNAFEKKNINTEIDIDDEAMVVADSTLMELVWNNIISNAIKFTPVNGNISIKEKREDGMIKVTVSDDGCGMTKEIKNHIFDKFYQGDTSHSGEGNGLGLALVKRVIELNNADIQVISNPGEGSTFTVMLRAYEV